MTMFWPLVQDIRQFVDEYTIISQNGLYSEYHIVTLGIQLNIIRQFVDEYTIISQNGLYSECHMVTLGIQLNIIERH